MAPASCCMSRLQTELDLGHWVGGETSRRCTREWTFRHSMKPVRRRVFCVVISVIVTVIFAKLRFTIHNSCKWRVYTHLARHWAQFCSAECSAYGARNFNFFWGGLYPRRSGNGSPQLGRSRGETLFKDFDCNNDQNLTISHNSPPDPWPVCFMMGAKRHFVGLAPKPIPGPATNWLLNNVSWCIGGHVFEDLTLSRSYWQIAISKVISNS